MQQYPKYQHRRIPIETKLLEQRQKQIQKPYEYFQQLLVNSELGQIIKADDDKLCMILPTKNLKKNIQTFPYSFILRSSVFQFPQSIRFGIKNYKKGMFINGKQTNIFLKLNLTKINYFGDSFIATYKNFAKNVWEIGPNENQIVVYGENNEPISTPFNQLINIQFRLINQ